MSEKIGELIRKRRKELKMTQKDVYKKMPKLGSEVTSPDGKATVISVNMLTNVVKVKIESKDGSLVYKDFQLEELKSIKVNNEDEKLTREEWEATKALRDDD